MSRPIPKTADFGNPLLAGIEEIRLPPAIDYWPVAPGWDYLTAALFILLSIVVIKKMRLWWKNRYRRAAVSRLEQLQRVNSHPAEQLQAISVLLKATALQVYPRREIASISGQKWPEYLNRRAGREYFDERSRDLLGEVNYRGAAAIPEQEISRLFDQVSDWIKRHPGPQERLARDRQ